MHGKQIKIKDNKIFKRILFIILFIVLFFIFFEKSELSAETDNKKDELTFNSVFNHINILRDGRVEAVLQFDVKTKSVVNQLNISVPYQKNQSITISDIKLAEANLDEPILEYIKATQVNEFQKDQINSYTISDLGDKINIKLKTSLPEATTKRIRVSYTINSASQRFNDAAVTDLTLFDENRNFTISGYTLIVSFDSVIFPEEISKYNLYEHNSLDDLGKLLQPAFISEILTVLNMDKSEIIDIPSDAYISYSNFIPENTRVDIRLLYPSDWLAKTKITLTEDPNVSVYEKVKSEESTYIWKQIQKFRYQVVSRYIVGILLILASVYFVIVLLKKYIDNYKDAPEIKFSMQAEISAAGLAFLKSKKVDAYTVWAVIYTLISKGFLDINQKRLWREDEQLLPDETQLQYYERVILHWIWNSMEGKNSISLGDLSQVIQSDLDKNMNKLSRFKKAMDLHCIENNYLLAERKIKTKKIHLIVALFYIISAVIISLVSNFFVPTWLLLPGGVFLVMALKQNRYTDLGLKILGEANSYKKYLRNVDRYYKDDYSKDKFIEDFIFSMVLQCNDRYLQSLKYILPMSAVVKNRCFTSLGFNEIETNVYKELSKQKIEIPIKRQKEIYKDISDIVERRLLGIQHLINKLDMHRIFPKKEEIDIEVE